MTHSHLHKVDDTQLVITLPEAFKNKQVRVTIDDRLTPEDEKLALMKLAASDPLFLADMNDVNDDFEFKKK